MPFHKTGIIDRIEEDIVVVEIDGEMVAYEKERFPEKIQAGDVIEFIGDQIIVNQDETIKRKSNIDKLMEDLWED